MSKKQAPLWLGHLSIFGANFIYGANYSIAKQVMPLFIKPMGFILLRVTGATLLFWALSFFLPKEPIDKADWQKLFWCAIFGVALNQLMFFKGLNLTTPINAAIIMICTPILVLLISHLFYKDRFSWNKTAGVGLGIAGALSLILAGKKASFGNNTALGDFFILINATSFGIYLVLAKPLILKYHVVTVSKWIFLIGLLFVIPFGFTELGQVDWNTFTPYIWTCTAFVIVAVTFLAYLFNNYGLKVLNAGVVSYYIYLQPFLAGIIAISLGKDQLSAPKVIAAILIFTGVYLISKKTTTS